MQNVESLTWRAVTCPGDDPNELRIPHPRTAGASARQSAPSWESALPADIRERAAAGKRLEKDDIVRWQKILARARAGALQQLAGRVRRHRLGRGAALHLRRRVRRAAARRAARPSASTMVGPVIIQFGSAGAEGALPAAHPGRRRLVVPGLFRTRRGLRPRLAQDARACADGRPLRRQRPEDLDHARPVRRLDLLPGAHRPRGPSQQEGITFLLIDMKSPGITRAPDHHARRRARGQRGLLRGRAGAGREPASARRTRAGPTPSSCWPTSAPTSPASAARRRRCERLKSLARRQPSDNGRPLHRGRALPRPRSPRSSWN